ncbi:Nn.00g041110.m01.CDS01 [Neocucurbitaria sp. VM-36]
MAAPTISLCKFVGTISLGLLTGVSATLSTVALPALLALPTAVNARTSLTYLSYKSTNLTSYLRHITTFTLFSAYLLSPKRLRHPYLLYTSIFAFVSTPAVDYAVSWREGTDEKRQVLDLEAQGDQVNGEQVRQAVERKQLAERAKTALAGLAFAMQVVGIWGDGA